MITLRVYDPVLAGNAPLMDVSKLFKGSWRRSWRRIGGCWLGTCEATGERGWLDEFFEMGMLRELRETAGSEETWRGMLVKMEYARGGEVFTRDVGQMANAVRSIYSAIGDNLLTNGSGESGAWTAYNGATVTQDGTWSSHGAYSVKVVVADTTVRGATVQTGITIAANRQYVLRATLNVTSGSWRVAVNRSDNDESLAFFSTAAATGDMAVNVSIPESNVYAGTVYVRVTSEAAAGTINVDAMVFQLGPMRAETGWYVDAASVALYGRKEEVLLRGGMSTAGAAAECESVLLDKAWVNPRPPNGGQTWLRKAREDTLRLTFAGYWATLNWLYTTLHGTQTCSAWVSALAELQSTYATAGLIDSNSTEFFVDDRAPLRVGDVLREVAEQGASGGAKYAVGVMADRTLRYELISQALSYYRQQGRLYSTAGGEVEPWLARPGWALWQDMPARMITPTANAQHDPRWVFLEEVEMYREQDEYVVGFKLN